MLDKGELAAAKDGDRRPAIIWHAVGYVPGGESGVYIMYLRLHSPPGANALPLRAGGTTSYLMM
jgi:hypothetical protein